MSKTKNMNFEDSLARVDKIISMLEEKGVSLEDSVSLYEEAVNLIKDCHSTLEKVEGKVKKIVDKQTKELGDIDA